MAASDYGNGPVKDRTQEPTCRCGVPKQKTKPPLLLCTICDSGPLLLLRKGER